MKVLIISHEYPPLGGGGANALMHLSKEYADLGHQVTIVTAWYEGLPDEEKRPNLRIIRLRSKRAKVEHCSFPEMFDYLLKALKAADRLQKEECFDLCQIFFAIPSGPVGWYLKKKYKLPYVIRFGGGDIPGFQERFKTIYKLIGPFEKILLNKADALVVNSEGLKKMLMGFYDKKPVTIITNGADMPEGITQGEVSRDPDSPVNLLFVSRLIARKGVQDYLPHYKELCDEFGKKVHLTIVGDGPYRQNLEELTDSLNIRDNVTFVGQKNKDELPGYYTAGDIFVFPSHKEGMPNVVLEAMSYGLPIIMTPCEGSAELIHDNGYAVSVSDFNNRIRELISDNDKLSRMSLESKRMIAEDFNWSNVALKYEKLLESVKK